MAIATTTVRPAGNPAGRPPAPRRGPGRRVGRRQHVLSAYGFLLPGLVVFAALMVWPMLQALRMSLYHWNILPGAVSEFTGAANYTRALHDPVFWRALGSHCSRSGLDSEAQRRRP